MKAVETKGKWRRNSICKIGKYETAIVLRHQLYFGYSYGTALRVRSKRVKGPTRSDGGNGSENAFKRAIHRERDRDRQQLCDQKIRNTL